MNLKRIVRIAALAWLGTAAAFVAQAPSTDATATIRGIVVDAATDKPVQGAVVELLGIERGKVISRNEITGKDGLFQIRNVPPAKDYQLIASDGTDYTPTGFGQRSANEPWTPLALAAGETLPDVRLVITPMGSITGKVIDGGGKPLPRARVLVLRATYSGARRELQAVSFTDTTTSGEFFVGRLMTGQYYVRVNPQNLLEYRQLFENPAAWDRMAHKDAELEGYPTFYYPGTTDLTLAKPVDLLHGGKAVDINITATKLHTRRVSGSVTRASGPSSDAAAAPADGVQVVMQPLHAGAESAYTRVTFSKNGQFEFRGMLPGDYYLMAIDSTRHLNGRKVVHVADTDLLGLSINAAPGFDVSGAVQFADWQGGNPPDFSQLAINLVADALLPIDHAISGTRLLQAVPYRVAPESNGRFVLKNVAPGDYRVFVSINPSLAPDARVPLDLKASYMKSGTMGEADVLIGGLHIDGAPQQPLSVTIATNSGSVFGRVMDDDQAAVPARLVLAPDKARRARLELFTVVPVTSTGRFTLDGVPPGDYKLFAWAHVDFGAWYDPEFLRIYEDRGKAVHVEESGAYPLEIPLIH